MKQMIYLFALLASIGTVNGAISLTFTHNSTTGDTTATYNGSWTVYTGAQNSGGPQASSVNSNFFFINGGTSYNFTFDDFFSATTFSWTAATVTGTTGDNFGFDNQFALYAPLNYVQGNQISGSATFGGSDLASLGLTNGETGTYTSTQGNTVSYSAVSVVPEPSSILLISLSGLSLMIRRKRVNC